MGVRLLFHAKSLHLGLSRQLAIITTLHSKGNREPSKGKAVASRPVKYLSLKWDAPQCTAIAINRLNPANLVDSGMKFSPIFLNPSGWNRFLYTPDNDSNSGVLSTCGDRECPELLSGLDSRCRCCLRRGCRCTGSKITLWKYITVPNNNTLAV